MGGISSYYDGETGIVTRVEWERGNPLYFYMHLKNNPNREYAMDYNSDIRIDPTVRPGDHVIYKKLSDYAGFWFKQGESKSFDETYEIRNKIRREKYRQLCLPPTIAAELLLSMILSAIVTIAFYIFRHKPGETLNTLMGITFLTIFISLALSGLFRLLLKYPTISDIKYRGIKIVWDTIIFLVVEIIYVIAGTLIVIIVIGLTIGVIIKIFFPEINKLVVLFFDKSDSINYIIISGFSIWAIIHLRDLFRMKYPPEECE